MSFTECLFDNDTRSRVFSLISGPNLLRNIKCIWIFFCLSQRIWEINALEFFCWIFNFKRLLVIKWHILVFFSVVIAVYSEGVGTRLSSFATAKKKKKFRVVNRGECLQVFFAIYDSNRGWDGWKSLRNLASVEPLSGFF